MIVRDLLLAFMAGSIVGAAVVLIAGSLAIERFWERVTDECKQGREK